MRELAAGPWVALAFAVVAGFSASAILLDGLGCHSTVARILLLFAAVSSLVFLAVAWRQGVQPFRYPIVAWVLVSSNLMFFLVFWSGGTRGPRLFGAILLLASCVSCAVAPGVSWPWRHAQSTWFLWSEVLYSMSAGALLASAARASFGATSAGSEAYAPLHMVAVALVMQTLSLILLGVGAQVAWGTYWMWDPIESWRLAAWLATAALAIVLGQLGWRRRRAQLATTLVAAFVLLVLWASFPLVHWLGLVSAHLPN